MRALLRLSASLYDDVIAHLLPPNDEREQAAFLVARVGRTADQVVLEAVEAVKLRDGDFVAHEDDYIEMADEMRVRLIKRAHDLQGCLVETHSHLGDWPAAFSIADRRGLKETVPHMRWRLAGRPYLALVVCRQGFDALLWLDDPRVPRALDAVIAGDRLLKPSNLSLEGW
jgi:hypothetical protein